MNCLGWKKGHFYCPSLQCVLQHYGASLIMQQGVCIHDPVRTNVVRIVLLVDSALQVQRVEVFDGGAPVLAGAIGMSL